VEHLVALPQYDILGYLIVGLAFIAACDFVCGTRLILRADWSVTQTVALAIGAYIAGHMLAVISTAVVETALPPPVEQLMCEKCAQADFFYNRHLPVSAINKINKKSAEMNGGNALHGIDLFWDAYNTAKQDEHAFERIVTFHQLFNFSRNTAFASFIVVFLALIQCCRRSSADVESARRELIALNLPGWLANSNVQAFLFFVVAVLMFLRYLYFFRAHAIEVLTSFAFGH